MRTRDFADEEEAAGVGCDRQMIQKEMCSADGGAVCHGQYIVYRVVQQNFTPEIEVFYMLFDGSQFLV